MTTTVAGCHDTTPPMKSPHKANERPAMTILTPFEQETARLRKLVMMTLETPCEDKTDIIAISSRVKRMRGEDPAFTKLAHVTAARALRWAWFKEPGSEQNLMNAADALVKALDLKYQNK
jgi:hypothetical protein